MEVQLQPLINLIAGVVLAGLGWFARQLWEAVKALEKDVHAIEVALPTNYVSKDDYNVTMKRIEEMFQRITDKLDDKMDKVDAD